MFRRSIWLTRISHHIAYINIDVDRRTAYFSTWKRIEYKEWPVFVFRFSAIYAFVIYVDNNRRVSESRCLSHICNTSVSLCGARGRLYKNTFAHRSRLSRSKCALRTILSDLKFARMTTRRHSRAWKYESFSTALRHTQATAVIVFTVFASFWDELWIPVFRFSTCADCEPIYMQNYLAR